MPQIIYFRKWCCHCNEWQLFHSDTQGIKCTICNTGFTPYVIELLPEDKIIEQQKRYRKSAINYLEKVINPLKIATTFDIQTKNYASEIIEDDAGYIAYSKHQRKINSLKRLENQKQAEEFLQEKAKYKEIGRNDKCICGSGKKFKHCECYIKYK